MICSLSFAKKQSLGKIKFLATCEFFYEILPIKKIHPLEIELELFQKLIARDKSRNLWCIDIDEEKFQKKVMAIMLSILIDIFKKKKIISKAKIKAKSCSVLIYDKKVLLGRLLSLDHYCPYPSKAFISPQKRSI